ncbi:Aste57867_20885 [Aphanomyces stellatus]|uniref:Aste57867_20885 protein n=1 Tax=Aphanomyces stellatus TaxID=120398 RepID=A0A485LHB5_9STRA|nr:hypothetical protein As57867_020817 [Aphanomyces stellatus]VFT97562.1 Aste57867_20885 [Aphanomyces stellatus]
MACGMTPEIMEMLSNMSKHQEEGAQTSAEEYMAQMEYSKQAQSRYDAVQAKRAREAGYDWTREYEKWDAWEDPEELAAKETAAREKAERARMRTSCNHDHSAEQKLMDMSTRAKLTQCDTFRRLGNRFFTHGQYQRAAYHYHRALIYFEYIFPDTDDEQTEMDALKVRVLLNFGLCRLKTKHIDQAIHHATLALKIEPDSVKALYIRAVGHRMQDAFDDAQADLDRAAALSTTPDAALTAEKRVLAAKKAAYRVKSKQLGAAMFNPRRSSDDAASRRAGVLDVDGLSLELEFRAAPTSDDAAHPESLETWQPSTRGKAAIDALVVAWATPQP